MPTSSLVLSLPVTFRSLLNHYYPSLSTETRNLNVWASLTWHCRDAEHPKLGNFTFFKWALWIDYSLGSLEAVNAQFFYFPLFKKNLGTSMVDFCVKTLHFQYRGCRFDSWLGSWDPTCLTAKKTTNIKQKRYFNKFNKDFKKWV